MAKKKEFDKIDGVYFYGGEDVSVFVNVENPEFVSLMDNSKGWHGYFGFKNGKWSQYTGCTTALGVIAKPALIQWAADEAAAMALTLAGKNGSGNIAVYEMMKQIKSTADWKVKKQLMDDFEKKHPDYKLARTQFAKQRDAAADEGTALHALVEAYINNCVMQGKNHVPVTDNKKMIAFAEWAIKENVKFIKSEQLLKSDSLWIAGTADIIFEWNGKRYIGDIKTYKKIWDKVPVMQCAGYSIMYEEMGLGTIDGYCIICLPKERDFNEADDIIWSFDVVGDREAFISAVTLYKYLNQ